MLCFEVDLSEFRIYCIASLIVLWGSRWVPICGAQVAFGEVFDEWPTTKGWTGKYHLLRLPHQLPYHLTFRYCIHLCHGSPDHRDLA